MRKYVLVSCIVLFSMAVLGSAIANQEQAKVPSKVQSGQAVSIDAAANLIVIKDDAGTEVKILTSPATKITREGKKAALADLKPGDKVTSECEETPDGCKAKSVQATGPKA
jgi:hypothetical protein